MPLIVITYHFFFGEHKRISFLNMDPIKLKLLWAWISADPDHALPGAPNHLVENPREYAPGRFYKPHEYILAKGS